MKLTETLLSIQCALEAPKDQHNSFGGYKYRSLEGILTALKPLLKEHGCTLILRDEIVAVGERIYVKATATLTNGEEVVEATAFAREALAKKGMDEAQVTGAASSYARKYCLNGLFAIDDTKDADSYNKHEDKPMKKRADTSTGYEPHVTYPNVTPESSEPQKKYNINPDKQISEKQSKWLRSIIDKKKIPAPEVINLLSQYNISNVDDLTMGVFNEVMDKVKAYQNDEPPVTEADVPF